MAQKYLIIGLYLEHKISANEAAELMGITLLEFVKFLAEKNISYFREALYPDED